MIVSSVDQECVLTGARKMGTDYSADRSRTPYADTGIRIIETVRHDSSSWAVSFDSATVIVAINPFTISR